MRAWMGLACLTLVASACSSSSSGSTGPASDAASSTDTSSPGDAGGSTDAGEEGDGATVCNALPNTATPVTVTQVAQDPPAPQGGTVADGTYKMTSETIYTGAGGATGPMGTQTVTIQITGATIQVAKDFDPPTSTYTLATSGTGFTTTGACPPGLGPLQGSYTATPTSFTVLLGPNMTDAGSHWIEEVFAKQ
jgi:hypothetical protein